MTEAVWVAVLNQFAVRGTRNEAFLARMLLAMSSLPGGPAMLDRFALELLDQDAA
jgi:hypothetical protein